MPARPLRAGGKLAWFDPTNPNVPNVNGSARPITPALLEYVLGSYLMGKSSNAALWFGPDVCLPSSADVACSFDGWLYDQLNYYQLFAKVGRALGAASRLPGGVGWVRNYTDATILVNNEAARGRTATAHVAAGLRFINGTALGGRTVSLLPTTALVLLSGPSASSIKSDDAVVSPPPLPPTWGYNYDRSAPLVGVSRCQTVRPARTSMLPAFETDSASCRTWLICWPPHRAQRLPWTRD